MSRSHRLLFLIVSITMLILSSSCAQYWAQRRAVSNIDQPPLPVYDGPGAEMIGRKMPAWNVEWVQGQPEKKGRIKDLRGDVVLVSFWTNDSPYTQNSIIAMEALWREFGDDGFTPVAIFHPTPPAEFSREEVERLVREHGITFPVAIDPNWDTLNAWWREQGEFEHNSASLLLDKGGRLRFISPGPELVLPEFRPQHKASVKEYVAVRQWTQELLKRRQHFNWLLGSKHVHARIDH